MNDDGRRVTSLRGQRGGKYTTILADPPWDYGSKRGPFAGWADSSTSQHAPRRVYRNREARPHAYKTLPLERIKALPVDQLAAKNAHLYLWATDAVLPQAYDVVRAWGFKPSTLLYWRRHQLAMPRFRTSHGPRSQAVPLIVARRGRAPFRGPVVPNVIDAGRPLRGHSSKPAEFYPLIERMAPPGPRLEIFSRGRREGWDAYGNQATQRATIPAEKGAEEMRRSNPLVRGYSREAISANVSREMHGGRDQAQAVAIALATARRAYRSRHPRGRLPAQLRRNPRVPSSTSSNPLYGPEAAKVMRRMDAAQRELDLATRQSQGSDDPEVRHYARKRRERLLRELARLSRRLHWESNPNPRRRRRRNPDRGGWIDLLVPLAFVVLLVRGGRLPIG